MNEFARRGVEIEQLKNEITELKWIINDTSNRLEHQLRFSARAGELVRRSWRQLKHVMPNSLLVNNLLAFLKENNISTEEET